MSIVRSYILGGSVASDFLDEIWTREGPAGRTRSPPEIFQTAQPEQGLG